MIKGLLLTAVLSFGFLNAANVASAQMSPNKPGGEGRMLDIIDFGWNVFHVNNCHLDSNGAFHVYPLDSLIQWISTLNPATMAILMPACQTGNFIGIFVNDFLSGVFSPGANNFVYNEVVTFPHK